MGNKQSAPVIASDVPPAEIYEIEESEEKAKKTLRHLIRGNHISHSVLYNKLQLCNELPHILCSIYALGGTSEHLRTVYDNQSESLEAWRDSPEEVVGGNWRDYVGDRRYQRAFVDFFEDEFVRHSYDWKSVLFEFLLDEEKPLINGLIGGFGNGLIHLGFAIEFDQKELAMEALALSATTFSPLHRHVGQQLSNTLAGSLSGILERLREDTRLDGIVTEMGNYNPEKLFEDKEAVMLEYLNAIDFSENSLELLGELARIAVQLLVSTEDTKQLSAYDFYFAQLLSTAYAIRVVLPKVEARHQKALLKQQWLLTLAVYITQLRPAPSSSSLESFDISGKDWTCSLEKAKVSEDVQFVRAIRALHEFGKLWKDDEEFYVKAAVKFAESFEKWGGFEEAS